LLVELLSNEGYEVAQAADAQEALALLPTWQPDLAVLDLVMPGMDDPAFGTAWQPHGRPHAPVLVLSALPAGELRTRADALGAAAVLAKPYNLDALLTAVGRLTESAVPA